MLEKNKNEFIEIYKENITRPGSDKLLNYLISEQSDFLLLHAAHVFMVHMPEDWFSTVLTCITVLRIIFQDSVPKTFTEWNILTKVLL